MAKFFIYRTFTDLLMSGAAGPLEIEGGEVHRMDPRFQKAMTEHMAEMTKVQRYQWMLQMAGNIYKDVGNVGGDLSLDTINIVYEYIWENEGKLTWRVTPEALDFLFNCTAECRTSGFMLPRDTLVLTFPEDFHLPVSGLPLRSAVLGRLRSKLAIQYCNKLGYALPPDREDKDPVTWYAFDFGECTTLNVQHHRRVPKLADYDWHYKGSAPRSYMNIPDNINFKDFEISAENFFGSELEAGAVREGAELCSKILWYAKARPQQVVAQKIKSKPHQNHPKKVHEVQVSAVYLDAIRTIQDRNKPGTGRTQRPHMRSGSIRELRHSRFKRNDDGSPKVIVVDPYVVGVDDPSELPESAHVTEVRAKRGGR